MVAVLQKAGLGWGWDFLFQINTQRFPSLRPPKCVSLRRSVTVFPSGVEGIRGYERARLGLEAVAQAGLAPRGHGTCLWPCPCFKAPGPRSGRRSQVGRVRGAGPIGPESGVLPAVGRPQDLRVALGAKVRANCRGGPRIQWCVFGAGAHLWVGGCLGNDTLPSTTVRGYASQ